MGQKTLCTEPVKLKKTNIVIKESFPSCPCENDTKSIEYYTKKLKHISKTFRPICQKFCFF
eukprot:UN21817